MNSRDLGNFLCGAAIGAAVCALLAPKSGPQYRNFLRAKANAAAETFRQSASHGEELLRERASDLKAGAQRQKTGILEAMEAGREAYQKATTAPDGHARPVLS